MSPVTARTLDEAWILAGTLDGVAASPPLADQLGGIPYVTRLVLDAAAAGCARVHVIWTGERPLPDLRAILADPRIAGKVAVTVARSLPVGGGAHILVVRADRVYHRDVPKVAAQAYRMSDAAAVRVCDYDAVVCTSRANALALLPAAPLPGALDEAVFRLAPTSAPAPYLGFCVPARDRRGIRAAEGQLVRSLRKSADGIAAKLLNRRLSLPITRLLANTGVHPNHVTIAALVLALCGGAVIAHGGWVCGAIGMLLVEAGSIVDGIDGELARLRFQFSRKGQWLDTIVDDIANLAYATGVMINLADAGAAWAYPLGIPAMCAFILTQSTQYWLILRVYGSGDLAAIPWAFQSSEFLSQRPDGVIAWIKATAPKMLKRDFVVTLWTTMAIVGRLDVILVGFSAGAFVFLCVLYTQLVRNRGHVKARLAHVRGARSAAA